MSIYHEPGTSLSSFFKNLFIYLLFIFGCICCCTWAFSSCSEWGLLFVVVHGLLIAVASLVAEHGPQARGLQQLWPAGSVVVACGLSSCGSQALKCSLSSCGTRAQLLHSMWDLPGPGIWFKAKLCDVLALYSWINHLIILCFSFFTC